MSKFYTHQPIFLIVWSLNLILKVLFWSFLENREKSNCVGSKVFSSPMSFIRLNKSIKRDCYSSRCQLLWWTQNQKLSTIVSVAWCFFLFLDLFWANNKMIWYYEHLTLKSTLENYINTELYISGFHTRSPWFWLHSPMCHHLNFSTSIHPINSRIVTARTPDGLARIYTVVFLPIALAL